MGLFSKKEDKNNDDDKLLLKMHNANFSDLEDIYQELKKREQRQKKEENKNQKLEEILKQIKVAKTSDLDSIYEQLKEIDSENNNFTSETIYDKVSSYNDFIDIIKNIKDDTIKERMLDNFLNKLSNKDLDIFYNKCFLNKEVTIKDLDVVIFPEQKICQIKNKLIPSFFEIKNQEILKRQKILNDNLNNFKLKMIF